MVDVCLWLKFGWKSGFQSNMLYRSCVKLVEHFKFQNSEELVSLLAIVGKLLLQENVFVKSRKILYYSHTSKVSSTVSTVGWVILGIEKVHSGEQLQKIFSRFQMVTFAH